MNKLQGKEDGDAPQTLLAIQDFTRFLEEFEKSLGRVKGRMSREEIRESARLVQSGIQEGLHYLAIVRKVIEKTQRMVPKRKSVVAEIVSPSIE